MLLIICVIVGLINFVDISSFLEIDFGLIFINNVTDILRQHGLDGNSIT